MKSPCASVYRFLISLLLAADGGLAPAALSAQSAAVGTIEGRVLNARNGEYVASARITVEGAALETLTEADGTFRLSRVPVGAARVTVFYTGLLPRTTAITVAAASGPHRRVTSLITSPWRARPRPPEPACARAPRTSCSRVPWRWGRRRRA